jgi:hypothetical protein
MLHVLAVHRLAEQPLLQQVLHGAGPTAASAWAIGDDTPEIQHLLIARRAVGATGKITRQHVISTPIHSGAILYVRT